MNFRIDGCVMTNPGKVRANNEDNYNLFGVYRDDVNDYIRTVEKSASQGYALAAVLDGMGGESAGEVASFLAAQSITACPLAEVKTTGLQQILLANQKVCEETTKRGGKRMGTTYVGAYFENGKFTVANVGDSRCYLYRGGVLTALSKDHSMGQRMIDSGVMTEEEARKTKSWHELTQHFGIFPEEFTIEPYFTDVYDLCDGDELLLCSDGLTDMMVDAEIASFMAAPAPIQEKVSNLLNGALNNGGRDNVTVMILRAVALDSEEKTIPYDGVSPVAMAQPVEAPVAQPVAAPVQPVVSAAQPVAAPVQPVVSAAQPVVPPVAPVQTPVAEPIAVPNATPVPTPVAAPVSNPAPAPAAAPAAQQAATLEVLSEEEIKLQKSVKVLTIVMVILIVIFVGLAAALLYLLLF